MARKAPPAVGLAAAALAVGALSLLWASIPQFDPSGWLLWGRGLLAFGFRTEAYPSWKPLPGLVSAPLALTGGAAPALWLVIARGAVVGLLVAVFRVARRWGGVVAGLFAVAGLVFVPRLVETAGWGDVEPLVAALVVGAVERHLAGRPRQGLVLLGLAGLGRPEAWALLAPYAAWLARREPRARRTVALVAIAVPVLWFGGDWIGSGDPFHGSLLAMMAVGPNGPPDSSVLISTVLGYAIDAVSPVWLAAALLALAPFARPRRGALVLLAGVLVWVAAVVFQAAQGYPIEARFLIPAGALACVLAGVGLGSLLSRVGVGPRRAAVALALAAVAVSAVAERPGLAREIDRVDAYQLAAERLDRAVAVAGARGLLAPCHVTSSHPFQARLAWDLGRPTTATNVPRAVGLAFERVGVRDGRLRRFLNAEGDRVRVTRVPLATPAPWALLRLDSRPVGGGDVRCRAALGRRGSAVARGAGALGLAQGESRAVQELIGPVLRSGERDAHRGEGDDLGVGEQDGLREGDADAVGEDRDVLEGRQLGQDGEGVAAQPGDEVRGPRRAAEAPGDEA